MIEWFRRKRPRGETPPQIAASGRFVELRRKNEPSVEIPNPNDIGGCGNTGGAPVIFSNTAVTTALVTVLTPVHAPTVRMHF